MSEREAARHDGVVVVVVVVAVDGAV